jgi:hypothetical protein
MTGEQTTLLQRIERSETTVGDAYLVRRLQNQLNHLEKQLRQAVTLFEEECTPDEHDSFIWLHVTRGALDGLKAQESDHD